MSPMSTSSLLLATLVLAATLRLAEMRDPLAVSLARMKRQSNYLLYPELQEPSHQQHHFDSGRSLSEASLALLRNAGGAAHHMRQFQQHQQERAPLLTPETLDALRQLLARANTMQASGEGLNKRASGEMQLQPDDTLTPQRQGRDWMTRLG